MASPPCTQETHHLKIDIDFDRILTITFPHPTWAGLYMDHLEQQAYHEDCRARMDDAFSVSMKLPKNVDRVHIGLSTSAAVGSAVALVFDSRRCAQSWLANSPLWEPSRSASPAGAVSAVLRTRWMHGEFEGRLAGAVSGGRDGRMPGAPGGFVGPPRTDRFIARMETAGDVDVVPVNGAPDYPRPAAPSLPALPVQVKQFWRRR